MSDMPADSLTADSGATHVLHQATERTRARTLGLCAGRLPTGPLNAITDVPGVRVGQITLVAGEGPLRVGHGPVRTGVTVIMPPGEDAFVDRPVAAAHVINGFGKSVGLAQLGELGQLETPIALTNTLSTWTVADALVDHVALRHPAVGSVNPVVGECNDGFLNDILGRHVRAEHVHAALAQATGQLPLEGAAGAGCGMTGFGWKGGIGTSSRCVDDDWGRATVGILVLNNTGAAEELRLGGFPLGRYLLPDQASGPDPGGSIMIILATDAPLEARQLGRVARRTAFGLARAGGIADHGSGDFCISFTTGNRVSASGARSIPPRALVPESALSRLFLAAVEATEEAIANSLIGTDTMHGRDGHIRRGLPLERLRALLLEHHVHEGTAAND